MHLVVGLGNPGRKYNGTRHNIGFVVLAELARRHAAPDARSGFEAEVTETTIAGRRTLLAAPQTYMNLSGRSVQQIVTFYKLPLEDLLVVCDDMNLPAGKLRLRKSGSAGGQKGLQNIIDQLGTQDFSRLRIGIGRPPENIDAVDYVLTRFRSDEKELMDDAVSDAASAVETWLRDGADAAMNSINASSSTKPAVSPTTTHPPP
jgi:PTH1 family peptidyl-tRNA hydrolase